MLPSRPSAESYVQSLDGRYADEAMEMFARAVGREGTKLPEYETKLFGGSSTDFGGSDPSAASRTGEIGQSNVEAAVALLAERNMLINVADVCGRGYRRLVFDIKSGDAWVKYQYPTARSTPTPAGAVPVGRK